MDTTSFRRPRTVVRWSTVARWSTIACAAVLAGCVVPATSVHYGQVASDPGVYYDPAPVYSSGTYYDPGPYYVPPAVIGDRPMYYPWYPVAPSFGAHFHGHRGDSHRHRPPGAHRPDFRPDHGRSDRGAARPPRPNNASPAFGVRPNHGSGSSPRSGSRGLFGGGRPYSGDSSGP